MAHGLSVSEMDVSIETLRCLSEKLNADCVELRRRQEHHGCIADLLIRQRADERDFIEVRLLRLNVRLSVVDDQTKSAPVEMSRLSATDV